MKWNLKFSSKHNAEEGHKFNIENPQGIIKILRSDNKDVYELLFDYFGGNMEDKSGKNIINEMIVRRNYKYN